MSFSVAEAGQGPGARSARAPDLPLLPHSVHPWGPELYCPGPLYLFALHGVVLSSVAKDSGLSYSCVPLPCLSRFS